MIVHPSRTPPSITNYVRIDTLNQPTRSYQITIIIALLLDSTPCLIGPLKRQYSAAPATVFL